MLIQVKAEGPLTAKIAIVGEQGGRTELATGRPFLGPAGHWLTTCAQDAGLTRQELYITNVLKAGMNLEDYIQMPSGKRGASWHPNAQPYLEYLDRELRQLSQTNVVVAMGNVALFALTGLWGITKWCGSVLPGTLGGHKVVPSIHPASILRGSYVNRFEITRDLARANEESNYPDIRKKERHLAINPTFDESYGMLDHLLRLGRRGEIIDLDIEVVNEQLSCIAFAWQPDKAISIPFTAEHNDKLDPEQELIIMQLIAQLMEDPLITKRGQNLSFDLQFLLNRYGIIPRGPLHDTMIAQKIAMPDFPAGLAHITKEYTDINYYKDDGKRWFKIGGTPESFWRYNAMDAISCAAAHPHQMQLLEEQHNLDTYRRKCDLIYPLLYMSERGIKVDIEAMNKARVEAERKRDELAEQLNKLAGHELNFNSPKQVAAYFYDEKGIKPYTNKGSITTDDTAMTRLARRGFEEARLISELRTLDTKVLGTYLDPAKISRDGRFRCYYNPVGAGTGRLSSSESIFGEGGNLQNWPHELLRFLVPDDGYIFLSFDLSQAENRLVAYIGPVPEMIEAFEQGLDVHSLTASLIFGIPYEQVIEDDKNDKHVDLAGGKFTARFWGKRTGHSSNYGIGAGTLGLKLEVADNIAAFLLTRYHQAYPGIQQSFQAGVRLELQQNERTLTNLYGRRRQFLDQWGESLFKEAYAFKPQSTVADKIDKEGLLHIWNNQDVHAKTELVNQVHDSIGIQLPLWIGWEAIAAIAIDIKRSLERPLTAHARQFTIPVDMTIGYNLRKEDGREFKKAKFIEDPVLLGKKLEEAWNALHNSALS